MKKFVSLFTVSQVGNLVLLVPLLRKRWRNSYLLLLICVTLLVSCKKNRSSVTVNDDPVYKESIIANLNSENTDIHIYRGISSPGKGGFLDNEENGVDLRNLMSICKDDGFTMINGYRDMYLDKHYGEFEYADNSSSYTTKQEPIYTSIRNYAKTKNYIQICQIAGHSPSSGFGFDPSYPDLGKAGYFPLPIVGNKTTSLQNAFCEWAINSEKNLGSSSIWMGAQEPTHTIGGISTLSNDENLFNSIDRYITYWKPIADKLRTAGLKTGGIQLNSSNSRFYDYAINKMKSSNLQVDFLTFQLYEYGDLGDMTKAVNALKSYRLKYPDTKIIINRGSWSKSVPGGADAQNSSLGVITFLNTEKFWIDNPNTLYGFTLDQTANGFKGTGLYFKTVTWLNKELFDIKCELKNLPDGVTGFASKSPDSNGFTVVLWNSSSATAFNNLNIKLNDGLFKGMSKMTAYKGAGTDLYVDHLIWDLKNTTVSGINLGAHEFILIKIL